MFTHPPPEALVFITACLLRLWVLFRSADTSHFLPVDGDMKFYNDWALRIAGGQWTDHQAFYGLPLYAYLLAALYSLIGFQPYVALLLQVIAESCTALLISKIAPLAFEVSQGVPGKSTIGKTRVNLIGWLAALGWIFFVPAQAYSTVLMPTTYFVASFWFVVWWTLRERFTPPRGRDFLWLGLFMGFEAMMVANILFLTGFLLAALFFRHAWNHAADPVQASGWRSRGVAIALLCCGIGLGASPCWLHNYYVAGEPVLLSAHSGINLWIGNNPEANGYPKMPAGMRSDQEGLLRDSITFAEKIAGRPLRRYEVSAYWSTQAHQYVAAHPRDFLRLLGVKLRNFWNGYPYDDLGVIRPMREDGVLLPGPGFGFVASLGLPGLLLAFVRRSRGRWVAAAVLLHMSSLLTVFITERYRLAAVPGLLLLGSYGVVEACRLAAACRWVFAAVYAFLVVGAALLVSRPLPDPGLLYLDDYNSGVADLESNHLERARAKLERVYVHNPNNAETAFAMGNLSMAIGHPQEARNFYARTLRLDPQNRRAMNNLSVIAIQQGHWRAAIALLGNALRLAPGDAKTYYLLARVHLALYDWEGARASIHTAIQLAPDRAAEYQPLRGEIERSAAILGPLQPIIQTLAVETIP